MTSDQKDLDGYMEVVFQYAMQYLNLGWSIIPMRFSDKRPAIKWQEFQERHATEEEVTDWVTSGVPDGNGGYTKLFGLAVITGKISNLVVLDCDNQDAVSYAINDAGLFSMLTVETTRGVHMYFTHPGERISNKAGGIGVDWPSVSGLDLRGDGGYVVAPPSLKTDSDGKLIHQYHFNCPQGELENFVDELKVWPGIRLRQQQKQVSLEEWSFDQVSLASVKTYGETVWTQMKDRVAELGRKLRDGDGRNPWLTKYVGECVGSGMDEGQTRAAVEQFQSEFYDHALDTAEAELVIQSVISADKRNHPEKYEALEKYASKNAARKARSDAIRMIRPTNLAELRRLQGDRKYLVEPFVPAGSIIQVVGFNGHGKSIWLMAMLWAAARGQSFGSAYTDRKLRVMYLDFEGSTGTLIQRIDMFSGMVGDMVDEMMIWNASAAQSDMSFNSAEGVLEFQSMINEWKPQVIVIDTVRAAWSGMEENSPHSWTKVNDMARAMRDGGMSVILIHHRNKPGQSGHGREAGSTAQLKDVDLQVIVTKVVESDEQANREAAQLDMLTQVSDSTGYKSSAWAYLRRTLPDPNSLKMVFELSFGKQRQATENHVVTYVGMAEDQTTGKWTTVSSLTPLQKALKLHSRGADVPSISSSLGVSQPTVKGWIEATTRKE